MSDEAPQSLQRVGLRRAVHDRPADTRVDVPGSLIWQHFKPELCERYLRAAEASEEEGPCGA